MQYIIVSFRSRNQTAKMYEIFTSNGIPSKIINTPREVNVGCGISIRFDETFFLKAKMLANSYPQTSFVGFFRVFISGSKYVAKRI